jgi:hypothetical protein
VGEVTVANDVDVKLFVLKAGGFCVPTYNKYDVAPDALQESVGFGATFVAPSRGFTVVGTAGRLKRRAPCTTMPEPKITVTPTKTATVRRDLRLAKSGSSPECVSRNKRY